MWRLRERGELKVGKLHTPPIPCPMHCFLLTISELCVHLFAQLCLTLCSLMNCSLSGSSVCGILQERILEWVAIPFSRGFSQPRYQTWVSCIAGGFFPIREACSCVTPFYNKLIVSIIKCFSELCELL